MFKNETQNRKKNSKCDAELKTFKYLKGLVSLRGIICWPLKHRNKCICHWYLGLYALIQGSSTLNNLGSWQKADSDSMGLVLESQSACRPESQMMESCSLRVHILSNKAIRIQPFSPNSLDLFKTEKITGLNMARVKSVSHTNLTGHLRNPPSNEMETPRSSLTYTQWHSLMHINN